MGLVAGLPEGTLAALLVAGEVERWMPCPSNALLHTHASSLETLQLPHVAHVVPLPMQDPPWAPSSSLPPHTLHVIHGLDLNRSHAWWPRAFCPACHAKLA